MAAGRYYNMCRGAVGRAVEVRCVDGRVHRGIIDRVTPNRLYLRPLRGGYGYAGYGYGAWAFGWGFAWGAIATLFFIPWFFF